MTTYTLEALRTSLGLSRTVISGLIKAGVVTPTRGTRREYRFSFQDMVLLRTAHSLQTARIAPRKILRALGRLRDELPQELPLTGLRISVSGQDVTVREGGAERAVESGQLVMDFEVRPDPTGHVRIFANADESAITGNNGRPGPYEAALEHERAGEVQSAEAAYRSAIGDGQHVVDAALNLGVLLIEAGRYDAAAQIYIEALKGQPDHALLHYNLAVALEDLGSVQEALAAYEACLRIDPTLSDAHFNAGRLYERAGDRRCAVRHYAAYRRLQRT